MLAAQCVSQQIQQAAHPAPPTTAQLFSDTLKQKKSVSACMHTRPQAPPKDGYRTSQAQGSGFTRGPSSQFSFTRARNHVTAASSSPRACWRTTTGWRCSLLPSNSDHISAPTVAVFATTTNNHSNTRAAKAVGGARPTSQTREAKKSGSIESWYDKTTSTDMKTEKFHTILHQRPPRKQLRYYLRSRPGHDSLAPYLTLAKPKVNKRREHPSPTRPRLLLCRRIWCCVLSLLPLRHERQFDRTADLGGAPG